MHQYPRLARARTGEHQHVCLLPLVGDDALLAWIVEAFDDGSPRFRGGLPLQFIVLIGQPTT